MAYQTMVFSPEMHGAARRFWYCDTDADRTAIPAAMLSAGDMAYVSSTDKEWYRTNTSTWQDRSQTGPVESFTTKAKWADF